MNKKQVDKNLYFGKKYNSIDRFISYYYQINSILDVNVESYLEIGVGNKIISNFIKESGKRVVTCDLDKDLKPDFVADVRKLPFNDNSYDAVLAFEILEHIPFNQFKSALEEIKRVSAKYVIISIPYKQYYFDLFLKFDFKIRKRKFKKVHVPVFRFERFDERIDIKKNGQHHWEMGVKGYSKKKIRRVVVEKFKIIKEFNPREDPLHYFFILEK